MQMKKSIVFFTVIVILTSCAKIVTPVGGPKDVTPPKIVKEFPPNQSVNFQSKLIKITFDEFVVLNNPVENVIFSPPINHNPIFSISGKSVVVKINDTLDKNKTYSIGFSNAIKDFTEGNPIPFYTFTFSTGEAIDSFMIEGKILNAESLEPESNSFVFLYNDNVDSLPLTKRPTYLSKSQADGSFAIKNIVKGDYKIFALKDINNNLIFDLPNESIAFSENIVTAIPAPKSDTISTSKDSIEKTNQKVSRKNDNNILTLWMFNQKDTVQKIAKTINSQKGLYQFPFKLSFGEFHAKQLKPDTSLTYFECINMTKDTVTWYFKDEITDSVIFELRADNLSPDTVILTPYKSTQRGLLRGAKKEESAALSMSSVHAGDLYRPLTLNFSYPIHSFDSIPAVIIKTKKSGNDTVVTYLSSDGIFIRSVEIPISLEEKVPFVVLIRDSVFKGYNNLYNDSIRIAFTAKSEQDYGNLTMNYSPEDNNQYIVSLITSGGMIVQKDIISSSVKITYEHLLPGNYKIKAIRDDNKNGLWNTGNYKNKQQPEKISYFSKPITVRGYWDLEETFEIK
jgi:uncharacterized protein (DUF2141 family)